MDDRSLSAIFAFIKLVSFLSFMVHAFWKVFRSESITKIFRAVRSHAELKKPSLISPRDPERSAFFQSATLSPFLFLYELLKRKRISSSTSNKLVRRF
jgi:hypothetical protein